jgi:hypothetical protein
VEWTIQIDSLPGAGTSGDAVVRVQKELARIVYIESPASSLDM